MRVVFEGVIIRRARQWATRRSGWASSWSAC